MFCLARLVGPLRILGYRAGTVSVTKAKAQELLMQMEAIAEASGLEGLRFLKSGFIESPTGSLDILSADKCSGHASGFDDAIADELGLLEERDRALINGMRSAISAKNGRFIALSIQGDAPFTQEMITRRGDQSISVHLYRAHEDCLIDDPRAWHAANPGIKCGIKSLEYMRDEARRVLATPADQGTFKAFDLNLPQDPAREMICSVTDWKACIVPDDELPPRTGQCFVGFDLGGSASMSALVAMWSNGRVESWGAFPAVPDLNKRGETDAVGSLYQRMHERSELEVLGNRVTDAGAFLKNCAARLAGEQVLACGADRYRKAEAIQALEAARLRWPMQWRGTGAHKHADGSHDVRAFQNAVLAAELQSRESLLIASVIKESAIRRDGSGNPALDKARTHGRIDVLSAGIIAAGLRAIHAKKPRNRGLRLVVAG